MKIRILGCGPSYGLPNGCRGFGDCDPHELKNWRTRSGIIIEEGDATILVDTPPEVRMQLFQANVCKIDAVLWTHLHADHTAGIDDVKCYAVDKQMTIPAYLNEEDVEEFKQRFYFYLNPMAYIGQQYPTFELHSVHPFEAFTIKDISFLPILQHHGDGKSLGVRVGDFAYNTDVDELTDEGFEALKGIKTWILGCVTRTENHKHLYLAKALKWIERVQPQQAFLTHMGAKMDYAALCRELPPSIRPCYDGMEIELK